MAWTAAVLALLLGTAAWAMIAAAHSRAIESQAMRALADLHRMRHATRALLSERAPLPGLAAHWTAAVNDFAGGFAALGRCSDDDALRPLLGEWEDIRRLVGPGQQALDDLAASPLAGSVGDEGVEQSAVRLMSDRTATADLLLLRRLQRQLGAFDAATGPFAGRLDGAVQLLGQRASRSAHDAIAYALLILLGTLAIAAWLLARVSLLNLDLRCALESLGLAQQEQERRETMLRSVLDTLGDGVALIGADGLLLWSNPALRRMADAGDELCPGSRWSDRLALRDQNDQPLLPGTGQPERRWLDARLLRARGDLHVDLSAIPVHLGSGRTGMLLVLIDLTERRALEVQLRQAQALETLGRLAGGVAHDFNNLLAGILGTAELLANRLADQPELRQRVDTIITASTRAAVLTRQLLESARRSTMQRGPVELHGVIRDTVALLERTLDRRIRVSADLAATQTWIDGDAALLQNALANLAFNSRDAMPQGGELRFTTANAAPPDGGNGAWLEVRIADQGSGIPPEILPRIFEPFFTTKPVGKGTGLGLAAVLGTVTRHGGSIAVDSQPGAGTAFTIRLPCCNRPISGTHPQRLAATPPSGSPHRILLADDEELVRAIAREQLGELGYAVRTVANGQEAVESLRAEPQACDIAILDVVMPRMGGIEAHREIRKLRPHLPILLWSGYSGGQDVEPLLADGHTAFLVKPAGRVQLAEALERLRRPGGGA